MTLEERWHKFIYRYYSRGILSSSAFERDSLAFIKKELKNQKKEIRERIKHWEDIKTPIGIIKAKRVSLKAIKGDLGEMFKNGYNQAIDDILQALDGEGK